MQMKLPAIFAVAVLAVALLFGCGTQTDARIKAEETGAASSTPAASYNGEALLETYYLGEDEPAHSYLQNNRIQKIFAMWLNEYRGEDTDAQWDYTTLAPVQVLDHDFHSITDTETELYTCTFTTANGEKGYIIVAYNEADPSIQKWSLRETTPHQYDLRANLKPILAALADTDIDMTTATATRVEWIDTDKNRGDRIILFADDKGDRYVCYLGDDDFSVEKQ